MCIYVDEVGDEMIEGLLYTYVHIKHEYIS
jgi:hypothetical protein